MKVRGRTRQGRWTRHALEVVFQLLEFSDQTTNDDADFRLAFLGVFEQNGQVIDVMLVASCRLLFELPIVFPAGLESL